MDGSYHSVDSSEMAFKIAASLPIKRHAGTPILLEPIYNVEVRVPENFMGILWEICLPAAGEWPA